MKKKNLSVFGIGPIYVLTITFLTLVAILLDLLKILDLKVFKFLRIIFVCFGFVFIIIGIFIWIKATVVSKISVNIKNNKLVTDGIYGVVRNPIYSAFMFVNWGILLILENVLIFILIPLYWVLLTLFVKNTEEVWLRKLYGKEYDNYCKDVNRCIPFRFKGKFKN